MAMVFQAGSGFHVSRRVNSFVVLCVGLLQELKYQLETSGTCLVLGGASGSAKRSATPGPVLINNDRLSSSVGRDFRIAARECFVIAILAIASYICFRPLSFCSKACLIARCTS
jgi:hypothetical protein